MTDRQCRRADCYYIQARRRIPQGVPGQHGGRATTKYQDCQGAPPRDLISARMGFGSVRFAGLSWGSMHLPKPGRGRGRSPWLCRTSFVRDVPSGQSSRCLNMTATADLLRVSGQQPFLSMCVSTKRGMDGLGSRASCHARGLRGLALLTQLAPFTLGLAHGDPSHIQDCSDADDLDSTEKRLPPFFSTPWTR